MANYAISKYISTAEPAEEIALKEMPASRFGIFKAAFNKKLAKMALLNLLAVVGGALGIYFYFNAEARKQIMGAASPFSANLGIGYPFSIGTDKMVALEVLKINFTFFWQLIPSMLLLGLFLSGVFYVVKRWAYLDDNFNLSRVFFTGVKKNWFNFLIIYLLLGGVLFLFNFALQVLYESRFICNRKILIPLSG